MACFMFLEMLFYSFCEHNNHCKVVYFQENDHSVIHKYRVGAFDMCMDEQYMLAFIRIW